MLPSVPWYQERRIHQTSLGSLMIIILVRIVKYNLSKLRVRLGAMLSAYFLFCFDNVEFILPKCHFVGLMIHYHLKRLSSKYLLNVLVEFKPHVFLL